MQVTHLHKTSKTILIKYDIGPTTAYDVCSLAKPHIGTMLVQAYLYLLNQAVIAI